MQDIRTKSQVYDGMVKSPNRALLRATGMKDEDFKKTNYRRNQHLGRKYTM